MTLIKRTNNLFPFFDDFFIKDWEMPATRLMRNNSAPAVNIRETDNEFLVELAAPGMKKDDFNVELNNELLTISAEVKNKNEVKEDNYTRREFRFNSFSRTFTLPHDLVNADKIKANYEDGILSIDIPKLDVAKAKPVRNIKIG